MLRTSIIFKTNVTRPKTGDAINIAARYFVYKLFEATDRRPMAWLGYVGWARHHAARCVWVSAARL